MGRFRPFYDCPANLDKIIEPTSGLEPLTCSLRVIGQALQGCAQACNCRISKPLFFLWVAEGCTVLRSRWYQEVMDYNSSNTPEQSNLTDAPGQTPTSRYPPGSEKASGSLLTGRILFTGI